MTGSMVQAGLIAGRFDVPVVLAGGIGTGAQILRALAMGADGVLLGTRMLVAGELWPHGDYKQRIAAAQADDSCMVLRWTQRPRRVLCNDAARRLLDLEREGRLDDTAVAALTRRDDTVRAYRSGDCAAGMLACGQAVAFANGIQPVESIIDGLIDQFVTARRRFERRFGGPSS
jgi:nitronate monooxygenase